MGSGVRFALDCESTGLDLRHGARPYLVTVCFDDGNQQWWEWSVDPLTRRVKSDVQDVAEMIELLESADEIIGQNFKFDAAALGTVGIDFASYWPKVRDTLILGHLLHSGQRHDLTAMALLWLGEDIKPWEDRLEAACVEARRLVRKLARTRPEFLGWRLAKEGEPDMPSAKGGADKKALKGAESERPWKFDAWLPHALAEKLGYPADHPWRSVCAEYANKDSEVTIRLLAAQMRECRERGLERMFLHRMELPPIIEEMESWGATFAENRACELDGLFSAASARLGDECLGVAAEFAYPLKLPAGATPNGSLRSFCFDFLNLPRVYSKKAKTSAPSLDKDAMAIYLATLDPASPGGRFVAAVLGKRGYDSSLAYIANYLRHGIREADGMMRLHPSFNPTGTAHLRWACANPNGQNISKKDPDDDEDSEGKTVRYLFGPAPGREWWSLDYENIELRIPAYESGETAMIGLFERPDDPPYFGSYHLLNASIIYPGLFGPLVQFHPGDKRSFKCRHKATWYQWVKNAGFALIYGCGEETFDRTAHKAGGYVMLRERLPALFRCADKWIAFAERHGYVETLPDRDVGVGYPVECSRTEWGRISPTIPFNYHVSSTAMQAINKAMIRGAPVLRKWTKDSGKPHYMALQVHDEIILDFPAGGARNLPKVRAFKAIMEASGDDIGIPLKVSVSWHPRNWGEVVDWRAAKEAQVA